MVRYRPEVEPVVRWIEETPRRFSRRPWPSSRTGCRTARCWRGSSWRASATSSRGLSGLSSTPSRRTRSRSAADCGSIISSVLCPRTLQVLRRSRSSSFSAAHARVVDDASSSDHLQWHRLVELRVARRFLVQAIGSSVLKCEAWDSALKNTVFFAPLRPPK